MKTNSDSSHGSALRATRSKFVLSRRGNERGQVAIFVALIFQVVFVFFALLINVGLLVHHKINLQHSTDLAAYYGAMKQAEQMNAIAHINFQMRQAWKLLTWRYRVLGTFGFIRRNGPLSQDFPFNAEATPPNTFNLRFLGTGGNVATPAIPTRNGGPNTRCQGPQYQIANEPGSFLGIQDIPFFCAGHSGMQTWPQQDSSCQFECDSFINGSSITGLPAVSPNTIYGNSTSSSIANLTAIATQSLDNKCAQLGPTGARLLTKFLTAYGLESVTRSETIKMLAQNLSQDVGRVVDLDGVSIQEGSKRTFQNNLTGANFTGLSNNSFNAYNGLNANTCRFADGRSNNTEFLKKIDFQILNFYIQNCRKVGNSYRYEPEAVYGGGDPSGLSPAFASLSQAEKDRAISFLNPQQQFTIGYEKNPNCVEYFAVKTFSEPNIPFLPLAKIRLEATSIAKPFGGSIGPSFGTTWPKGAPASLYNDNNPLSKTDRTLPDRIFNPTPGNKIKDSLYTQPNFSLFVGDQLGARNLDYLATYHSMLVMRDINIYQNKNYKNNVNIRNRIMNDQILMPQRTWPDFTNWQDIDNADINNMRSYDSLANSNSAEAGTRAVELTAIAPNQFDITYYSIDPDFYNNYYIKIYKNFNAIKQASGNSVNLTANQLRADFGAKDMDGSETSNPLDEKSFSVKDQILLKNQVLDIAPNPGPTYPIPGVDANRKYSSLLNYVVSYQTSLLTGWTFLSFRDYNAFPGGDVNKKDKTMTFGMCDDPWNNSSDYTNDAAKINQGSFRSPMNINSDNPPTPGNCVTGGRTGYSVKLISPKVVLDPDLSLNPMATGFFTFPQ